LCYFAFKEDKLAESICPTHTPNMVTIAHIALKVGTGIENNSPCIGGFARMRVREDR
jgi:hypothetical protein